MAGLALGFLMFAAVMYQRQAPLWYWIGPVLHSFAMPHIGWWLARRATNPREAERINLLVDHFLSGIWMAPMGFSLLPCVLSVTLTSMDSLAGGGGRLVWRGLILQAIGVALGVAVFGFVWQPESSLMTVLACLPVLIFQPFVVSFVALSAIRQLTVKGIELERLNRHDGLSGLFNRSHWEQMVRAEFARFRRSGEPVVLVLADLDNFKRINDTYGHAVGDETIRRFAATLRGVLRETDVCGRYGGEEFGILLPLTGAIAAKEVIERLRRELHKHPLIEEAVVTASFGMVELDRNFVSVEEWLRVVDKMLYQAKHLGRDRVVELDELTDSALATLEV